MCACDTGYSGDGFNCTGIQLIPFLIRKTIQYIYLLRMKKKASYLRIILLLLLKKKKIFMHFYPYILDIDECLTDPCHANGTCNNTIGSYVCACDPGYSGDGFNCTGMDIIIFCLI